VKTYYDIVKVFDDSKFKKLPRKGYCAENNDRMFRNLWGMFKMRYSFEQLANISRDEKCKRYGCSVSDYAWTKEVQDKFYDHPYHKAYIKQMKLMNRSPWGWWILQCEPDTIENN
jgi:hypothetical protein